MLGEMFVLLKALIYMHNEVSITHGLMESARVTSLLPHCWPKPRFTRNLFFSSVILKSIIITHLNLHCMFVNRLSEELIFLLYNHNYC